MQITDVVLGLAAGVGIDVSPDGKTAYYVEWSIGELSKVDVGTGKVSTVIKGLAFPEDVEVDWLTGQIFVSERTGAVVQVFPGEGKSEIVKPGGAPHQLALVREAGKRYLYTVCFDSGQMLRIDVDTKVMSTIASGLGHPIGIVIDAAHQFAYITEQDFGALTRIELSTGIAKQIYSGLVSPFYLAWDKNAKGIFCVQRDPSNSLVRLELGPPVNMTIVANGLAWRPSGVAPSVDNKLIYICTDRKLEVVSFNGVPAIPSAQPPFEIHSIQFTFDGSNTIRLKDHISKNLVALPEYVEGIRNEPAAYVAGALPHIKVVLRKLPGFSSGTYAIGAVGSHGGVRRKNVTPIFNAAGLTGMIDFELMWPLPGTVERADLSLDWFARKISAPAVPTSVGSEIHRIYLLIGKPTAPWTNETPWVAALEIACGWAAGADSVDAAATLITEGYNGCGKVSYDTVSGASFYVNANYNLTQMIDRLNGGFGLGGKVNCTDSASTVSTLANVIGCDLWQARMGVIGVGFDLNPLIAIGYNNWSIPFNGGFNYHEVAWKNACTQNDNVFDGCLKVDGDVDPTQAPHTPLLPTNILFGDCATMNYRLRLCPQGTQGCGQCTPQPGTSRTRRSII